MYDFQNKTKEERSLVEEKIHRTIVGRNSEIKFIENHFDSVLEGSSQICFITGPSGIGKTFLLEHIVKKMGSRNVIYVYGKFRQHDKESLSAISQVIEQMVKHLLTLPYEQLYNIKITLKKTLGSNINIITSINIYAQKLLGHYKTINMDDYKKLKYRVKKAIYQFVLAVSELLFPLMMFIDDLQWADPLSLEVLQLICKDNEQLNLLFIAAYRDNKEKSIRNLEPLIKILQAKNIFSSIKLHELTDLDINKYLQIIFGVNTENLHYLARIIYGLTLGNPFYIKEIIDIFIQENILSYYPKRKQWIVEINGINNLCLPKDIEQIIINKMNKLSKEDKLVLEFIACFDGRVEYKLLKKIINIEEALLNNQLQILCRAGFLIKTVEEYQAEKSISYGFVHDIILENIYTKINYEKRASLHYSIIKKFINIQDKSFIESNRLFISSQLLRCNYYDLTQENTEKWITELYYAGMKAKETAAVEQALKIFQCCVNLMPYTDFKDKYNFEIKINIELGECEYICEKYEESKERFKKLIDKSNKAEDLITIKRRYMNFYSYKGDSEKVIKLGIEVLNHLDFKFNTKHLKIDFIKCIFLFSNRRIKKLKNTPMIKDKRLMTILETLVQMIPAANIVDDKIFSLILIKIGILCGKYGNSPYSTIGYAASSYIFHNILKNHIKGKKLKDITIELSKDTDNLYTKSMVDGLIGTFIDHWSSPMENSIKHLENSIKEGIEIGEFIYSGYSIVSIIYAKYIMGIPLKEIIDYTDFQIKKFQRLGDNIIRFINDLFKPHVNYLKEGVYTKEQAQIEEEIKLLNNNKKLTYYAFMLQRLYLEGEKEKAYQLVGNISSSVDLLRGHIMYLDLLFYIILTRLASNKNLQSKEKRKNKVLVNSHMKELRHYTKGYKENHYARYLIARAEYIKVFQKKDPEKFYNEAIYFAENSGQLQLAAIGNLLAAKNCYYNKKLSRFYANEAIGLFEKWGAIYIAGLINKEFKIEKETKLITEKIPMYKERNRNILYHLNQIENMDEEQGYIYMLDFLVKSNNTDYSAVLFEKADEMHLQYEKKKDKKVIVYKDLINMKYVSHLSRRVIRYVARTGEEVILNQKPNKGVFTNDLYIMDKEEISILCIPIKYLGVFVGAIYLEKMYKDGFNENIVSIIRGVIPSLISKRTIIKDVNLYNILNPGKAPSPLTAREHDILKLIAEGMSNSAISKELYITLGTVKNHLSNIYSKLEVNSRIKAVIRAKELNIIK